MKPVIVDVLPSWIANGEWGFRTSRRSVRSFSRTQGVLRENGSAAFCQTALPAKVSRTSSVSKPHLHDQNRICAASRRVRGWMIDVGRPRLGPSVWVSVLIVETFRRLKTSACPDHWNLPVRNSFLTPTSS